ncbi:MAG: thioredoxin domain-containing protein [Nitrospirae bacterium]|nr:thioredoxin domain-containing protein [Nitrospirota bacterium]
MNRLASERSPYLRHASSQKIDWRPWTEEAFKKAADENKPVFLSSGAVWCHWCHVMAKECFDNDEIAGILNEKFISIKLDRDEHPDIDRRYQLAVSAIGSPGGWPLTVFLTPDKRPFFGGTYFPPVASHGRPGFNKVLGAVSDFFINKKKDVDEYADGIVNNLRFEETEEAEPGAEMIDDAARLVLAGFDSRNGGFGTFPKFPMPGAIDLLMNRVLQTQDQAAEEAVKKTLNMMALGGFHDQLQGGFHRYSVDEAWMVPHFEKMADDNAWLLRNYISGFKLFGDARYREVAGGIIRFSREVLSDPDGGFYASQDADVTPDDEGGYFTWTDEDLRRVLDGEEYRVLTLHYLSPRGKMHHDESKYVLSIAKHPDEISEMTGIPLEMVRELISTGRKKLLSERDHREAPFIDTTIYTSLNGLFITAYMNAYRVFGDGTVGEFGIKSIERVLRDNFSGGRLLHCAGVDALLDDHIFFIEALLSAYDATGDRDWLRQAEGLMKTCIEGFWDGPSGGFNDARERLLGIKLKPIEDIPHPSANSVAISCLMRLYGATGEAYYLEHARQSLRVFSGRAVSYGIHASAYFNAIGEYLKHNA